LGGGDVVALGRVEHRDAALGRGLHVDVVHADTGPPDHPELFRGGDDLRRHLGAAANHQTFDIRDYREQLLRREPRAVDHLETARLLQYLEPLGREGIRNEDLRQRASPLISSWASIGASDRDPRARAAQ